MTKINMTKRPLSSGPSPVTDSRRRRQTEPRRRWSRYLETIHRQREITLVVALAVVVLVMTSQNGSFIHLSNIQNILTTTSVLAIVAVGETCVVVTRNIDLSVGSTVGLSAFAAAEYLKNHPHTSLIVIVLIGAAVGLALGLVNACLVTIGRVPSIVATLGTLYVFRGVDFIYAGNGKQVNPSDLPQSFIDFGSRTLLGIPELAWIALVVVLIFAFALNYLQSGRQLYAIGSNPDAARLAGIRVEGHVFATFCISGLLSGIAGVLWAAEYAGVDPQSATGFELLVVASVVVGGVNIFGGSGRVIGAALGALILTSIQAGLTLLKISQFWPEAIYGAAILLAVSLDAFLGRRVAAAIATRRRQI